MAVTAASIAFKGNDRHFVIKSMLEAYQQDCKDHHCLLSNIIEPLGNIEFSTLYKSILSPWKMDEGIGQVKLKTYPRVVRQ